MKKIVFCALALASIFAMSCGNDSGQITRSKTRLDSLLDDVLEGHNIGMAKLGKLTRAEQTTKRLLDSIAKLPEKTRQAAEPLKVKLDSLKSDLSYAEFAMNKWMDEFNVDSAIDNAKERIKYLEDEKLKVTKIKEAILSSLQKADSLLKVKI